MTFYTTFYSSQLKSTLGNFAIISFYAFREIYVSLLSTQQWAFIASHLDRSTSSYLVTFTGLVSIASALGGCAIEQLVSLGGVNILLVAALASILSTFICSELAYYLVNKTVTESYSLHPSKSVQSLVKFIGSKLPPMKMIMTNNRDYFAVNLSRCTSWSQKEAFRGMSYYASKALGSGINCVSGKSNAFGSLKTGVESETVSPKLSPSSQSLHNPVVETVDEPKKKRLMRSTFLHDSWNLMCKHHILQLLFIEAITHQTCTNMLNLMFHNGLGLEVSEDSVRAMLVGRFFATVNITACTLQCFILPSVLSQSSLPNVLSKIPFIVFLAVMLGVFRPGLISVMLGFGTIKVLEYSIMTAASEMIYMPMGHDVRYLGKELIKFFGHKLGKSAASLILSACVAHVKPSLATQSMWGAAFAVCWGVTMYRLSRFLKEREQNHHLQVDSEGVMLQSVGDQRSGESVDSEPVKLDVIPGFKSISRRSCEGDFTSNESEETNYFPQQGKAHIDPHSRSNSMISNRTSVDSLQSMVSRSHSDSLVLKDSPDRSLYSPTQDGDYFSGGICVDDDDADVPNNDKIIKQRVVACEFLPLSSATLNPFSLETEKEDESNPKLNVELPKSPSDGVGGGGVRFRSSSAKYNSTTTKMKMMRRTSKGVSKKDGKCSEPVLLRIGSSQISLNTLQKTIRQEA